MIILDMDRNVLEQFELHFLVVQGGASFGSNLFRLFR